MLSPQNAALNVTACPTTNVTVEDTVNKLAVVVALPLTEYPKVVNTLVEVVVAPIVSAGVELNEYAIATPVALNGSTAIVFAVTPVNVTTPPPAEVETLNVVALKIALT